MTKLRILLEQATQSNDHDLTDHDQGCVQLALVPLGPIT